MQMSDNRLSFRKLGEGNQGAKDCFTAFKSHARKCYVRQASSNYLWGLFYQASSILDNFFTELLHKSECLTLYTDSLVYLRILPYK